MPADAAAPGRPVGPAPRPGPRTGRRAVAGLLLTAGIAFLTVGGVSWVVAHRIARADALAEALRTAHSVGGAVVVPALPAVLDGDRTAAAALDSAVAGRRADGTLVRVTVWTDDGTVVWSNDGALVGRRFPVGDRLAAVFERHRDYAGVSSLDGPEHAGYRLRYGQLVQTYTAVRLDDGRTVALEMYFSGRRVARAEDELGDRLVPFALLSLLVLVLAQLPVSIWLVRRVSRSQRERARMLDQVLVSAERERRQLARNLHDGVVQQLTGVAFVLDSRPESGTVPAATVRVLRVVSQTVQHAIGNLREMLVELHPRDLTGENLGDLIESSAVRACPDQLVGVHTRLDQPIHADIAAFLYRCARECASNVARHAGAGRVDITLVSDENGVRLDVEDDGVGMPADALDGGGGSMGLVLLQQATHDLGGTLLLAAGPGGLGARVSIVLPPA